MFNAGDPRPRPQPVPFATHATDSQRMLYAVAGRPEEKLVNTLLPRWMKQACLLRMTSPPPFRPGESLSHPLHLADPTPSAFRCSSTLRGTPGGQRLATRKPPAAHAVSARSFRAQLDAQTRCHGNRARMPRPREDRADAGQGGAGVGWPCERRASVWNVRRAYAGSSGQVQRAAPAHRRSRAGSPGRSTRSSETDRPRCRERQPPVGAAWASRAGTRAETPRIETTAQPAPRAWP